MKSLTARIQQLRRNSTRTKSSGRVVFVHWDRETIDFLVVTPKSTRLTTRDIGSVPRADHANPLKALAEHFQQQAIHAPRLVALLSRPELDQLTLHLPPAEEHELPGLIASAVEQQLGEAEDPPQVDFYRPTTNSQQLASPVSSQVLAFALSAVELKSLRTQCDAAGFHLAAVGSRHLSPLGVLRQRSIAEDAWMISVHLYAGEAELAICRGTEPILLRSLRINREEPLRVAEQIWMETQRCLTLLPQEAPELNLDWCVFTTCDLAWQVARALEDRGLAIQPIDPLIGWEVAGREVAAESEHVSAGDLTGASAANAGAAWEFMQDRLRVNLLAPKQAPKPPNPLIRWAAMGTAAALVLGLGITFLLSDLRQLSGEVQSMESELAEARKLVAKHQEKADQVRFVEGWLADQVDWLAELNELSTRLPDGQDATVRRLTATTSDTTAVIDLSVQVAEQEHISQLESRIRSEKYSATSKRISQNADSSEYPWQFETRVSMSIRPPEHEAYAPATRTPPLERNDVKVSPVSSVEPITAAEDAS